MGGVSAVVRNCKSYTARQQHKEVCRFAAVTGAILTADFNGREYIFLQ